MAERAKTGNALLDAWLDAFAPVPGAGTSTSHAPLEWERMFLGPWATQPGSASAAATAGSSIAGGSHAAGGAASGVSTAGGADTDAPRAGVTGGAAPASGVPSGDAPGGDAPSGDAPSGDAPSGGAPGVGVPGGNVPGVGVPGTDAPAFGVPGFGIPYVGVPSMTEMWTTLAQRSLGALAALGATAHVGDPLGDALEQSFRVMGDVGGGAAEGPAMLVEMTRAATVLCAARETYRVFMLTTWQRALEEVTREAVRRAGAGTPVTSAAAWLSLANAVADRVFVEAFHSQAYLDVQRRLSSALADQRRAELKVVDVFAGFGGVPTRRAFDELGAEVHDLRRRVRHLERANRGTRASRARDEDGDER